LLTCCLVAAAVIPTATVNRQQTAVAAGQCHIPPSAVLDPMSAFFASLDRAETLAFDTGDASCLGVLAGSGEAASIAQRLRAQRGEYPNTNLQIQTVVRDASAGIQQQDGSCNPYTANVLVKVAFAPANGDKAPAANRLTVARTYTLQDTAPAFSRTPTYLAISDAISPPTIFPSGTAGPFKASLAASVDASLARSQSTQFNTIRTPMTHALARTGFVIDGKSFDLNFYLDESRYDNGRNIAASVPTFVTVDSALHTFHVIFDRTLLAAESTSLSPRLANLLTAMLRANARQRAALRVSGALDANAANAAYLAVALKLLGKALPAGSLPSTENTIVGQEVGLVQQHDGIADSPFLGKQFDYRLFTPRGHYNYGPELQAYFMAMNWLALIQAPMEARNHISPAVARAGAQRAVLLAALMSMRVSGVSLSARWHQLADPITVLIGDPVGTSIPDITALEARVYGRSAAPATLETAKLLTRFMSQVKTLPAPAYKNTASSDVRSLALFPARAIADGSLAAALTAPKVKSATQKRGLPSGLDVAAALGSKRAAQLAAKAGPWPNYMAALKRAIPAFAKALRAPSLYARWLSALRPLTQPMPKAAPLAMHTTAWADKELLTVLGSWSELRHDSILYAAQYGGFGGGGGCRAQPIYRTGYVEPIPAAWKNLSALTDRLAAVTRSLGLLNGLSAEQRQKLLKAETAYRLGLRQLATIAQDELKGAALTRAQQLLLHDPSGMLGAPMGVFFTQTPHPLLDGKSQQAAEIADVATSTLDGSVLEAGEGMPRDIWMLVPIGPWQWLVRGQVYSYYEFKTTGQRLTDQQWQQQIDNDYSHKIRQPAWVEALSR
jgi:hypothetical protein